MHPIVRWTRVRDNFPAEHALQRLADHEKRKAASFRFASDRQSYCAAHFLLWSMIHDAFGPKPYQLIYGSTGKPHVLMPYERHIEVSLSHSNGFAAAGVTSAGRLGVDIESFGKTLALKELEPLALSDRERTEFAHSVGHDRTDDVFLRRWTLKEAIVKATGQGLAAGFQNFAVSILPPGLLTRAPDGSPSAEWQLDVTSVNGGILAVALHQATTQSFPFDVEEYVFPGDGR